MLALSTSSIVLGGSSSRAHIVLIEFALVGIAGFALSSFALGRDLAGR